MSRRKGKDDSGWDAAGVAVIILAIGVAASVTVGFVAAAVRTDDVVNADAGHFLATALGAMIGAVAAYVGMHKQHVIVREIAADEPEDYDDDEPDDDEADDGDLGDDKADAPTPIRTGT